MTENNAIERCDMLINGLSIDNSTNNAFKEEGKDYPTFATMKEFAKTCKKALEKVQAFEEIGTVEEFKALKEKSVAKKVIRLDDSDEYYDYQCPSCGAKEKFCLRHRYCSCGQLLEY